MKRVVEFLEECSIQYLATIGLDGKPKCRPFMFATENGGKLWFCTNSQKEVYAELMKNPSIELTASSPSFAWIRLSGETVFENNMDVKKACMEVELIKGIYQTQRIQYLKCFT